MCVECDRVGAGKRGGCKLSQCKDGCNGAVQVSTSAYPSPAQQFRCKFRRMQATCGPDLSKRNINDHRHIHHCLSSAFTGTKKESMFKSPESLQGKVGVVGSGKGMTEFTKKSRHEHEADDD